MSLPNINYSPKCTRYLVASQAFKNKPIMIVDIGARGGIEEHWSLYGDQVKAIGFEADTEECERLNRQESNSGNRFYPSILYRDRTHKTFYFTEYPPSSGFYPVDRKYGDRLESGENLSVVKTLEVDTVDFDSFADENGIEYVDFMKLDTEGSELDILKGAVRFLRKSVIGLSVEVEFYQLHENQPVFSEVDSFLNILGFKLFDIAIYRKNRKVLPSLTSAPDFTPSERGQVIWGQALYLRDGVDEIESLSILEDGWDNLKILKLASIMELFYLPDCAIELLQVAQRKGFLQGVDVAHLIDMLVPSIDKKFVSYSEYLEKWRIVKYRGYVNNIERVRKSTRKFVPLSLRKKLFVFLVKLRDLINEIVK